MAVSLGLRTGISTDRGVCVRACVRPCVRPSVRPVDMNIYVVAALCDLVEQYTMELDTGCKHLVYSNSESTE